MLRTGPRSSPFVREIHVNFNPDDVVLFYGCCELSWLESPAALDLPARAGVVKTSLLIGVAGIETTGEQIFEIERAIEGISFDHIS